MAGQSLVGEARRLVEQAIRRFNRYRAPEAVAELLDMEGNHVRVRFTGPFTRTCGINDWVEDLAFILEDLGVTARLIEVVEPQDPQEEWRIGVFEISPGGGRHAGR